MKGKLMKINILFGYGVGFLMQSLPIIPQVQELHQRPVLFGCIGNNQQFQDARIPIAPGRIQIRLRNKTGKTTNYAMNAGKI